MIAQVSELFRQGIVRPLDTESSRQLLTYYIHGAIRCEWLPIISDAQFAQLWDSGLFSLIGSACNLRITDYEEIIIEAEAVQNAANVVEVFSVNCNDDVRPFAQCLELLLKDAVATKMPIMLVL